MKDAILFFSGIDAERRPLAGGKGGTLARLYQSGYPVPDGFVILPSAFSSDDLKAEVWLQVRQGLDRLRARDPNTAFAVRSSALGEDSVTASFAGEFETVLDVSDDDAVRSAISTVRRSRQSERVLAYSQARGIAADHEMAVVVQRLVRAEVSGVLFTADPVTGSRSQMVGNYIHGLGEELVSGEAKHMDFTLSRPHGHYEGQSEMKRYAGRLFKLASRLERELGGPQDIEWAIARGKVCILQSRPITTLIGYSPVTGEFNDSLTGDYVWSSVNVGEAVSVVMTPFTWSRVRAAYRLMNVVPGYETVGNIGGRVYQNNTVMASFLVAIRMSVKDLGKELAGIRDEYLEKMDQFISPLPEATFFAVLPNAIRVLLRQRQSLRNANSFLAENPGWCRAIRQRIPAVQSSCELATVYRKEIQPQLRKAFSCTVASALRYGELVGKLRRELIALVGAADADALLSNVSGDGELLASLGPVVGLAKLARGEMSREEYLEKWGHRGPLEAEAFYPRPSEDPKWLDQQLETFLQSPVDVEGLLAAQRTASNAAQERLQNSHWDKAKSIRQRLDRAAEASRVREAIRSELIRQISVIRTWALRAGDLTGIGEDTFFLTEEELLDLLAGKDAPMAYISARRETYERYKALPPLPPVIRGRFDPFRWAADPERRNDVFDSHGFLTELSAKMRRENVILGMPGSAGRVEGVVRRLDSPDEGHKLEKGEILVAAQTNIGWTLFFPKAAAVVTDVGAPLSHAAVVARELGIPAVVNCGDATARLKTGTRVLVDGSQGTVAIIG